MKPAVMKNEFEGLKLVCPPSPQPCPFPNGEAVLKTYGLFEADDQLPVWLNLVALVVIIVVLRFLGYVALRFLGKRK